MRHHNKNRKFGRETNQRKALMRSLCLALIKSEKIKTTEAKAKELRPMIEKLITRGKNQTLASKKLIISKLGQKTLSKKLIEEISPKYKERKGGYTRITKLSKRGADSSPMAIIEFV
ncbi:MAG: 50S ribosomal protein L17 [Candidatus Paceibacterota bacterium]